MLHEFIVANRQELIARCRAKVSKRVAPAPVAPATEYGVPEFLTLLVETLGREHLALVAGAPELAQEQIPVSKPGQTEIGRAAALHGAELLLQGYTIDQVVHDYGDVCQSVTDLAVEQNAPVTVSEFRTLNRCLDDAIADAVTSFGNARQIVAQDRAETLHTSLVAFAKKHRQLVDIAKEAYSAISTGKVGFTGATGTLLLHTLDELSSLTDRNLAEVRRASAIATAEST